MSYQNRASEAQMVFRIGGDDRLFRVVAFEGSEKVSELFSFILDLAMEESAANNFIPSLSKKCMLFT